MSLKIGIEAQLTGTGTEGGMHQVILGLVSGFGQLTDGSEEYVFVASRDNPDWLTPYLHPNQRVVAQPPRKKQLRDEIKNRMGPLREPFLRAYRRWKKVLRVDLPQTPELPKSNGFYESLGIDLLHITYPLSFVITTVPTIFTIHDLQHRHLPEFFSAGHIDYLEMLYSKVLEQCGHIVAISDIVNRDIQRQFNITGDRISTIKLASPTKAYSECPAEKVEEVRRKYKLPERFMLFPAVSHGHKNHLRLLQAMALLKEKGQLDVALVCTGHPKQFWPEIQRLRESLGLVDHAQFLGYVPAEELRALFRLSEFLIFPSFFEGAGLPLLEALHERRPIACSDIPPHREYAEGAALYFDPSSAEAIARAIFALSGDAQRRASLVSDGISVDKKSSWRLVAEHHRALYRKVGGATLTARDKQLLNEQLTYAGRGKRSSLG